MTYTVGMPKGSNPYADMPATEAAPFGWMAGDDGQPRARKRPAYRSGGRMSANRVEAEAEAPEEPGLLERDPDPAHEGAPDTPRPKIAITATVRKDIRAKIALMLGIPAMMIKKRDPWCGTVLVEQVPDIADALADLVADSPDLVEFFTGSGTYMKWLKLAVALQPVAEMGWHHHILRAVGHEDEQDQRQGVGPAGDMPAETPYHAPAFVA
jgi:hypothetical protein